VALLLVYLCSILTGSVLGLFLIPVVLRPFVSPAAFWDWIRDEPLVNIPLLSPLLKRWYEVVYGKSVA